jgi:hypothetical protein
MQRMKNMKKKEEPETTPRRHIMSENYVYTK